MSHEFKWAKSWLIIDYTSHDATCQYGQRKFKNFPKDVKTISVAGVEGKNGTNL